MALSNWDQLVVKIENKEQSNQFGIVYDKYGYGIEVYKNWIYLHDSNIGEELAGRPFSNYNTEQIYQGDSSWGSWKISAKRGPQEGIYFTAYSKTSFITGCGVLAYQSHREKYAREIIESGFNPENTHTMYYGDLDRKFIVSNTTDTKIMEIPLNPEIIGVGKNALDFLKKMQHENSTIDWNQVKRINQGDKFFSNNHNIPLLDTFVGEQKETVASELIRKNFG